MSVQQEEIHVCYCISGQQIMVRAVIGLSEKANGAVLLNEHETPVKLPK